MHPIPHTRVTQLLSQSNSAGWHFQRAAQLPRVLHAWDGWHTTVAVMDALYPSRGRRDDLRPAGASTGRTALHRLMDSCRCRQVGPWWLQGLQHEVSGGYSCCCSSSSQW